jgi:hypothetical protein
LARRGPINNRAFHGNRNISAAREDPRAYDLDEKFKPRLLGVKMQWVVIVVIHRDRYPINDGDRRHYVARLAYLNTEHTSAGIGGSAGALQSAPLY